MSAPMFTLSIVPFGRANTRVLLDLTREQVIERCESGAREQAEAYCDTLQPGEGACFGFGVYGLIRTE